MVEIFRNLSERTANVYATILASAGVAYKFEKSGVGWRITVRAMDVEKALKTIGQYHEENQYEELTEETILSTYSKTWAGIYTAVVLAMVHILVYSVPDSRTVIEHYGSSASDIIEGEQYRTITSLLLHGDFMHLMGNMLGMALFGTGVCSIAGWGVGLFIILFTGGIGNLLNAYFYQTAHLSIGASTAVFGCIGFLSAYQFMVKIGIPGQKLRAWISIAAGVALLGILGSSEHTDIMAHFFGFGAGGILGIFYQRFIPKRMPSVYQYACFIFVLVLLGVPWLIGPWGM